MKTTITLIFLLSVFLSKSEFNSYGQSNYKEIDLKYNDSIINWSVGTKLNWSDFKGNPEKFNSYVDKGFAAMTRPRLSVTSNIQDSVIILNIKNTFLKYES